ncbi:MAG: CPBP family intramembrane metalloprotease [Proteobacteria bacterium]|nr:CPBP family intramembrane metalloprotease [Pseudomonadota bacterium]
MDPKPVELKTMLLAAAAILLIEAAMFLIIRTFSAPKMAILGLTRLIDLGLMGLILSGAREGWTSVGLTRQGAASGLRTGLIWSAILGGTAFLALALLGLAGIDWPALFLLSPPPAITDLVLFMVVGGLIAPLAEEVLFRGLIFGFLRRWGAWAAVIGSTLIFVLAHQPGLNSVPVQTAGGLVFALTYERYRNLVVPMTIHVVGNTALFTLGFSL